MAINVDLLRTLISYDQETGALTWLERKGQNGWNTRYAGKEAFTAKNSDGYKTGAILGRYLKAHRVAWALYHGDWPKDQIDHINGDRADNRMRNLREACAGDNARNRKKRADNKSGENGVRWCTKRKKWAATVRCDGVDKHIGYYAEFSSAVTARKSVSAELGFHENHGR